MKLGAIEQAVDIFRDQFEWQGGKLYYRRGQKGPPVPVSEVEANQCVDRFRRHLWIVITSGGAVLLGGLLAVVFYAREALELGMWLVVFAFSILFGAGYWWAWTRPARRFEHRTPAGPARTSGELRRKILAERSWGEVFAIAGGGLVIAGLRIEHWPPSGTNDWLWVGLAALILLATLWSALTKLRLSN